MADPPVATDAEPEGSVAVVVLSSLAGAPEDDSLAELLGPVAAGALRNELLRSARRWAASLAGRDGHGAYEANSVDAALAALEGHVGPVVLVAPDVPGLDGELAEAVRGDLADGVGITFAPTYDASPFLIAMPSVDHELITLAGTHTKRDELFTAVGSRGVPVGMLRSERRLASAADARAAAADPQTPLEIGILLAAGLDVRARR